MASISSFQELGDKIGWFYSKSQETGQVSFIPGARRQDRLVLFQELGDRIGQFYSKGLGDRIGQFYSRSQTVQVSFIPEARRQERLVLCKAIGDKIGQFYSRNQETEQVGIILGDRRQDRLVLFQKLRDKTGQFYSRSYRRQDWLILFKEIDRIGQFYSRSYGQGSLVPLEEQEQNRLKLKKLKSQVVFISVYPSLCRIMQSMLFLYVPGVGLLQYPNHPETAIQQVQFNLQSVQ